MLTSRWKRVISMRNLPLRLWMKSSECWFLDIILAFASASALVSKWAEAFDAPLLLTSQPRLLRGGRVEKKTC